MNKASLLIILVLCYSAAFAHHVKGGYIRYEYAGAGSAAGTSNYKVTVTVFYGCGIEGPRGSVTLHALNASTGASVLSTTISTTTSGTATKGTYSSCFSNPPTICYEIYTYVTTITLTDNASGYILGVTDQYRTDNIINISNSSSTGIAFTAQIPGTINSVDYHTNTSPIFAFKDTAIVCYKGTFNYQFSASDPVDNDSLSYSFGNGLNSSSTSSLPFYATLPYTSGFSGNSPMGSGVTINPVTGLISGTAPATAGEYVIAVYVSEWRNGVLIDAIKKELQIYVYDCTLTAATLAPSYINCDNYTFNFSNESSSPNVVSYSWDFGVTTSATDVSTQATPTYTYADTGTYILTLKVSNGSGCSDSAKSLVKVYPGFSAGFTVLGSCYQSPFTFTDTTYIKYGTISSWSWNFGDPNSTNDVSSLQNPVYQYAVAGNVTVTLIVSSNKGCIDTATKTVVVSDKPDIHLLFADTLICSGDTLPLGVQSNGTIFNWTPLYNIINPATNHPLVYPQDTTIYTVTVQDKSCIDSAQVKVNVLKFITVKLPADTAICATDSITLYPDSYGLSYLWSESGTGNTLSSTIVKNPKAAPLHTTTYYVTANLGHCQDKTQTIVYVSPYPAVSVSQDTAICYGSQGVIHGYTAAAYYSWGPNSYMDNGTTLNPTVYPPITLSYTLTVTDTFYCPKPSTATVTLRVIRPVIVNAGIDTAIVFGQPLQLLSTSSADTASFAWTPATYLSNTLVYNPVATITSSSVDTITYFVTATTPEGCTGSDALKVTIYKTQPDIFVPTAFTPNGDGKNDVVRPIIAGVSQFSYFRIYNRWGQLIFETTQAGRGWDGTISGIPQATGTYVFTAAAKDYLGRPLVKKGTVVLIR